MSSNYKLDHEEGAVYAQVKTPGASGNNGNNTQARKSNNLEVPCRETFRTRTGSMVSFNTKCELFEIDLEREKDKHPRKPPAVFSLRYYVMFLALFSPFVVTYSRTIINFAIIDMINPIVSETPENRTARSDVVTDNTTPSTQVIALEQPQVTKSYFDNDNSCPVSDEQRHRLDDFVKESKRRASQNIGEKFDWDESSQGMLKGAYPFGHALLQVVSSRLSETYGSHRIMSASSLMIAIACLAAPSLASLHYVLMLIDLFVLGILGSFMTPALITLFSNWLTPSERSIMLSFYLVSSRLGYALSAALCGLLMNAQISWRYLFYTASGTSICFSVIFFLIARSKPHEHPFIKDDELKYLASKNTLVREALREREKKKLGEKSGTKEVAMSVIERKQDGSIDLSAPREIVEKSKSKKPGAPWGAIFTSSAVWAFVVTKFCVKLAGDTVQTELPVYFSRVMHISPKFNGIINASNYVIFCISCLAVGTLARYASKNHPFGWSKTAVRKLFQCSASFGVSMILILLSMTICQDKITVILLMLFFFVTTFATGGEAQIPLDISERYAGTIHAIGSSLAVSGAIEPVLVGLILKKHAADRYRWRFVWMGASAIAFIGGLVFLIYGEATIQAFDKIHSDEEEEEKKKKEKNEEGKKRENGPGKKEMQKKAKVGHINKSFVAETGRADPLETDQSGEHEREQDENSSREYNESRQI